jgi:hypothetical protein
MEMMVDRDSDLTETGINFNEVIEVMKGGCFFNYYKGTDNGVVIERIFMYYRADSKVGSLYYAPASADVAAPPRERPVPAGHIQVPLRRLTDIWLGKQTDVLLGPEAEDANLDTCWTIHYQDASQRNTLTMDLVSH